MSNLRSQIITETGQLTKLQLTLVQSETSLSWFYICDRQAGQTNKSTLFHCLFVLWTSCGGPTHTQRRRFTQAGHATWMLCQGGAPGTGTGWSSTRRGFHWNALPGGEGSRNRYAQKQAFIERLLLREERIAETAQNRNRVDIARLLLFTEIALYTETETG